MSLEERFSIVSVDVALPRGTVTLAKPKDPDTLIDEKAFAKDERLPYWADLWPSAIVLAQYLERTLAPPGARALELGCGLGLVTVAAMRAGYEVVASDYYDDALLFAARNAQDALGREPRTRMVDWRAMPADLGTFDLVLAADVLYERPYAVLVAEAIERTMAPGGRALLADQGRIAVNDFLAEAALRGLSSHVVHEERRPVQPPPPTGSAVHAITVYELRRS